MNEALAQELKALAYRLIALASDGAIMTDESRPGMVAVRPNGVRGSGVVHWWPATEEVQGENAWGYMSRMARTKNPDTGLYYFPPQLIGSYGLMQSTMPENCPWPEQADRLTYRNDWLSQAELDVEAEARKQWGEWSTTMQGR